MMLIDADVEIVANTRKPLNIKKRGSKAVFFISLWLKINGIIINENSVIILQQRYCIIFLSIASNQNMYTDIVNKTK